MFFNTEKKIEYLKAKDVRLAAVIDKVGHIEHTVDTALFSSVVHQIIGQQIFTKTQKTIWQRMNDALGEVTPDAVGRASIEELQVLGMTFRKEEYIKDFCAKVLSGDFDIYAVEKMSDEM